MKRLADHIYVVLFSICALMLAAMSLITVLDVIGRYFNYPIPGANELVGLLLVVVIACGVGFTQRTGGHIAVSVVTDMFPIQIRRVLVLISQIIGFCVAGFVAWKAVPFALESYDASEHTELLKFPWYPLKIILAFGAAVWAAQYMSDAWRQAGRLINNAPEDDIENMHKSNVI